jgi:alpha-glucosidase
MNFMKQIIVLLSLLLAWSLTPAQKNRSFTLNSPDKKFLVTVRTGDILDWSLSYDGQPVSGPSRISLQLATGEVLGKNAQVISARQVSVNETLDAINYKKDKIENNFNQLTIVCKGDYGIVFRAYNDGAAYRFFTSRKTDLVVRDEQVNFSFDQDYVIQVPFTSDLREGERYSCSFEEFYTATTLSKLNKDTLGYLPLLVQLPNNRKAVLLEADVQDYPALFVQRDMTIPFGLKGSFAPYPVEESIGTRSKLNYIVKKRADFIAKVSGTRQFPWRIIVVSNEDRQLLDNDMVQRLSAPPAFGNTAWIKPGKVAWDWWNDWNITHVDFRAGINTPTYKYYIDFAAGKHIEYVVLDEGWSDDWDLNKLNPEIDLVELLNYSKQKNVGLILWTTWYALSRDVEGLCAKHAAMGVKGFKVDFLDRNDQKMIASCYNIASIAAKYQLMLDFHGMFPPQGLQRTWPNVINFEGVRGMEYSKWSADDRVPQHEVSLPFIRMMAGPMDYTPGAMRNATRGNARPSNALPVSQGTRCHQMAMYIVYEGPLQMLADNPTVYMQEEECTRFIASVPTTFNQTIALDGQVGEFAAVARKKNDAWYVGAMTNWKARDIVIDLSFLGTGSYSAELFRDGVNADRNATDYKKEILPVDASKKLTVHLAPGGGCAIRISK